MIPGRFQPTAAWLETPFVCSYLRHVQVPFAPAVRAFPRSRLAPYLRAYAPAILQESEARYVLNTDEELYARFLCGHDDALGQLMDRHMNRLILFCFTFLHSVAEAEEMALDAFAVIAMKRNVWRGGSFQRWLYRIARNLSISRYRTLRLNHAPFDEAHHMEVSSAEAEFLQQEEKRTVLSHLERLPEGERQVLTLLYLKNASYARTAEMLGMDEKKVDNLAYRGKKRLREWLRQEEK